MYNIAHFRSTQFSPNLSVGFYFCANLMKRVREQCARVSNLSVATTCLKREELQAGVFHRTRFMDGLDLPFDLSFAFGVYVLRCAQPGQLSIPCYYVGFALLSELVERVLRHFDQVDESARFTKQNAPLGVEFLWPAKNRSAEAYVFYFMLEKYNKEEDVLRHVLVGGWTQTAAKPLGCTDYTNLERDYRMLKGRCLKCGVFGHKADSCVQSPTTMPALLSTSSTEHTMLALPSTSPTEQDQSTSAPMSVPLHPAGTVARPKTAVRPQTTLRCPKTFSCSHQ